MAELTEDTLIALFEATEKATEGTKKTTDTMKQVAEAALGVVEALGTFAESFDKITAMMARVAEAMAKVHENALSPQLRRELDRINHEKESKLAGFGSYEPWQPPPKNPIPSDAIDKKTLEQMSRDIELDEAKFSGPRSRKGYKSEVDGSELQPAMSRKETRKHNKDNRDGKLDLVFFDLDKETDAEKKHASKLAARDKAELKYAKQQWDRAKKTKNEAKAEAAYLKVVHNQKLNDLRKMAAEEEKIHKRREQIVASVGSGVAQTSEVMFEAALQAAEGQKVNVAEMLETFLKGVAKKHAVLAVAEAAMAATSVAMMNPAGVATHLAAAGMHAGVAVLAGGAAVGMHFAAGGKEAHKDDEQTPTKSGKVGTGGGGQGGGSGDDAHEPQEVPVSHEQLRRGNASNRGSGGAKITINNPHIYGAGGVKEFANKLRSELDRQDRSGRKPRL